MNTTTSVKTSSKKNGYSLLIIDEDKYQRKGLTVALMDYFSSIEMTGDFDTAARFSDHQSFDVIITQFHFDKLDGIESIKILKHFFPEALIILITKNITEENANKLSEIGIDEIYEKPINLKQLIQSIELKLESK
jgi:DNA-binding NtrC family response regulator